MKFSGPQSPLNFTVSYGKAFLRFGLFLGALLSIAYSFFFSEKQSDKILWMMDTSLSMSVRDLVGDGGVLFSRFDMARSIILSGASLSDKEHALLTFDSHSRLQLPFSGDTNTLRSIVTGLEPRIYGGETDIASALSSIALIYPQESFHVVLLTDGEVSLTSSGYHNLSPSIQVSVVGIGTSEGGLIIQGYDADGRPRYKQYHGENVISHLDTENLRNITDQYHGEYYQISRAQDLLEVTSTLSKKIHKKSSWDQSKGLLYGGVLLFLIAIIIKPYRHES